MKRALLMGINKYQMPGSDLRGCINDIRTTAPVLTEKFGFESINITILLDFECTTYQIKKNLEKIVNETKEGDTIFVQFSGHGSRVPDLDGDESNGLDEVLCPTDLDWKKNIILDDYLYSLFKTLPNDANLVILSDSCHSGSLLRNALGQYMVPRYIAPPPEINEKVHHIKSQIYVNDQKMNQLFKKEKIDDHNTRNGILLSGCRHDQTAADAFIDKKYQGAFTCTLVKILKDYNYDIAYSDLISKVNILLDKLGYSQNPQLECPDKFLNCKFLM